MASSAFKSTTRRTLHASDDHARRAPRRKKSPSPCPRRSRSVSVSAAPRARPRTAATAAEAGGGGLGDFANTRTNPLFDSGDTPSPSPPPAAGCGGGQRGREARKGCAGSVAARARSVSVAPQRRHAVSAPSKEVAGGGGRRVSRSRPRSVAGDARPCRGSDSEVAISKRNHSTVPVEQVLEIPPEFDPDSAEFITYISDYATEFNSEDIVEIPLEFDPDASELVLDERHHARKLQWGQMDFPLDFDPDSAELAPDITEYTTKLKQSHERARKLRADLAVEEQREQELSRMLKDIVTVPSLSETDKRRPRRKSSMERLKVSRHLAEEALNYFEECVSISTLDSTDFSSHEDPQSNSVATAPPKSNTRFLHKGESKILGPHFPTDRHTHHEESDSQTQCSISITGSDVSDGAIFSHTKTLALETRNNSIDEINGFDSPRSRSSCFSFTHEPAKTDENCDVSQFLRSFGRGMTKELRETRTRSSYCADDYVFQKVNVDMLTDIVGV